MSEQTDLGAILDAETAAPAAPLAPMAEPAPQTGDKPTASEPPAAAKPDTEPDHVPRAALLDERKKRQALENQLEQFQRQLQQQPQQVVPKPQEIPKDLWWTDPDTAARLQREEVQRETQRAIFETRAELSEQIVAAQNPDYLEMRDTFAQAAQAAMARGDDYLMRQLMASPNPAKFAYEMGKRITLANEIGQDPQSYRSRMEAEMEANFRKKYGIPEEGQQGQQVQQRQPVNSAPVPKSLGKAPSAQPRATNGQYASRGPTPLEDIIG